MGQGVGTRALSGRIREAIRTYRGDFSEANIHNTLRLAGGSPTLADAQAINRQLATALNRDVDIRPQDLSPDMKAQVTGGYRWLFGEHWELGFLAVGVYENDWRNKDRIKRSVTRPETDFVRRQRTVESVSVTGNFDVRAEWFWDSGDHVTVSAFRKDLADPIETLQGAATGDDGLFNFDNADAAEINGAELEGLKSLGFPRGWVGDWVGQFYVAGNVTLSVSRLDIHAEGLSGNITNTSRRMTQHSEWVVNLQMGFDSYDRRHGATLVYNSFGERIFFGGIDSFDDAYEQPFHALDFIYT